MEYTIYLFCVTLGLVAFIALALYLDLHLSDKLKIVDDIEDKIILANFKPIRHKFEPMEFN